MARNLKNTTVKLDLLADVDLLLMIEMQSEVEYIMHNYSFIEMFQVIINT